jgi:hypothetical protein
MAERVLRQTAFIAPLLNLKAQRLTGGELLLEQLTDGGKVTCMQLDAAVRDIHTPPPRGNAGCRKSQVHLCI